LVSNELSTYHATTLPELKFPETIFFSFFLGNIKIRFIYPFPKEEYSVCFSMRQMEQFSLMDRILMKSYYEETSSPTKMERLKSELDSCDVFPTEEEVEIQGRKDGVLVWLDEVVYLSESRLKRLYMQYIFDMYLD